MTIPGQCVTPDATSTLALWAEEGICFSIYLFLYCLNLLTVCLYLVPEVTEAMFGFFLILFCSKEKSTYAIFKTRKKLI